MQAKTVLITDLDNTLFDWVNLWVSCFSTMLDGLIVESGLPREVLTAEITQIHQKHGTSEYSFLVQELQCLRPLLSGRSAAEVFSGPIQMYRAARRKQLRLYPTVAETLLQIKGRGTKIVGYTESMALYSNYRIKKLGLDGVVESLFCPEDHIIPTAMPTEDSGRHFFERIKLRLSDQHFTPKGSKNLTQLS